MDAVPGKAPAQCAHPQLTVEKLGVYKLLPDGALHHGCMQLHGAVQQSVVSRRFFVAVRPFLDRANIGPILQLPESPASFRTARFTADSPVAHFWSIDQHLDRHFCESYASHVVCTHLLDHQRSRTASHGPHPSRMALLVRCFLRPGE